MIESFNNWLLTTVLNHWVMGTNWAWPMFETLHFFGLCLLLGPLLVIDLRLIGLFRKVSITGTHKLLPIVFLGFFINLTTGILFYVGDPMRYAINIGFQIKILLILLAGANALWFFLKIDKPMRNWDEYGHTTTQSKIIGILSLGLWFSVLACGRLIPYVGTG